MKALALLLLLLPATLLAENRIKKSSMGGDIDVPSAPNGATLRTMGGDIRVGNARGHVIAKTMGGDIRIRDLNGSVLASTMGGNVSVEVDGVGADKSIQLQSMGGGIALTLPANFSGTFEVELEQGERRQTHRIISDFPLQVRKSERDRWFQDSVEVLTATGRVGTGEARVKITTIGSDIVIRKK